MRGRAGGQGTPRYLIVHSAEMMRAELVSAPVGTRRRFELNICTSVFFFVRLFFNWGFFLFGTAETFFFYHLLIEKQ